jgi:2-amino-4-hydroxy-6-hydroxymethyldihydropteridine diphosphokinase
MDIAWSACPSFRACVALGSNLGGKPPELHAILEAALSALQQLPGTWLECVSPPFVSAPVQAQGPDFVNAVAIVQTRLAPLELLHAMQAIECAHGRERPYPNAPRTLDLDLVWVEGGERQHPQLQLPHPRWQQRAFVVEPLAAALERLPHGPRPAMPSHAQRQALLADQALRLSELAWLSRWP